MKVIKEFLDSYGIFIFAFVFVWSFLSVNISIAKASSRTCNKSFYIDRMFFTKLFCEVE